MTCWPRFQLTGALAHETHPSAGAQQVDAELGKSGIPIDLTELEQQHIGDLLEQLDKVTVDAPDAKVRVFCE